MFDHRRLGVSGHVEFIVDFGVTKYLVWEEDWQILRIPEEAESQKEQNTIQDIWYRININHSGEVKMSAPGSV